jgi:Zn-dependent protease with chaperone function
MTPFRKAEDDTPGLAVRAAIALALMIGFYGLALSMVAALALVPYLEFRLLDRVEPRLLVFCVVGAGLILTSIFPRREAFRRPGAPLSPGTQPRLFMEIEQVARAVGQPMPLETFLVPDVNAWVSERGGFMGVGRHRILGIGLPLLQSLKISELRAVLAHEFGHYHAGDTWLGPWVYKTRQAIGRTLRALSRHSSFLQKPFAWYGQLFLRVSLAVSRHQERHADALAASVAGAPAMSAGLRATYQAAVSFAMYWGREVTPVLAAGFRPPVVQGFRRFKEEPEIAAAAQQALAGELANPHADAFDSHPSLPDRLEALRGSSPGAASEESADALSLLDGVPELEQELLGAIRTAEGAALVPVEWEDVGRRVVLPEWRRFVKGEGQALRGVKAGALYTLDWEWLGRGILMAAKGGTDSATILAAADYAVGVGLGLALEARGYTVSALPGRSIRMEREAESVELDRIRERVFADSAAWTTFCTRVDIVNCDLGEVG